MAAAGLEELFDRFRREGDLDALAEVFDRTAEKLLKVARHFSQDEAQAEDVVQATFLAAIEGRDGFDASRELVPWLTGILTHKAKVARALSRRIPDPDRLPEPASHDPAVDVELRDLRSTLDRALERVPRAYCDVLRLHLQEGKNTEEIAHELGRPVGTVRVQLHRGLKHLRRGLPAGIALSGLVIATGPRGLAALRAEILEHAGCLMTTATSGGAVAGATLGGILMGKKIALVSAIVLVASSATWFASRGAPVHSSDSRAQASDIAEVSRSEDTVSAPTPSAERTVASSVGGASPAVSESYGALDLTWTWADGSPAAGIGVGALPFAESRVNDNAAFGRTDENGHMTFESLREGRVVVSPWRGCFSDSLQFETSVSAGKRTSASFAIPEGSDLHGKVVDVNDVRIAGAEVWIARQDREGAVEAVSAQDGTFLLRSVQSGCSLFATADRRGSSTYTAVYELDPKRTGRAEVTLRILGECAAVRGIVRNPDGSPVASAWTTLRCRRTMRQGELVVWPAVKEATSADGEFHFPGVHKGPAELQVFVRGLAVWTHDVDLEEDRTLDLDVRLEHGFTVRGVARTRDGQPVPGALVHHGPIPGVDGYVSRPQLSTKTNVDGTYVLSCIPSGDAELHAEFRSENSHMRTATSVTGRSGETLRWDPILEEKLKIRGRVVDERGSPLANWRIEALPLTDVRPVPRSVTTDAAGRFEVSGCEQTRYSVRVVAPGERQPRCSLEGVPPEGPEHTLVVKPETRPSAFASGRLLDSDGSPVVRSPVTAAMLDVETRGFAPTNDEGRFRVGPLPPGKYLFSFSRGNQTARYLGPLQLAADEERELGDVQIERPGQLELRLHRENGVPFEKGVGVLLLDEHGFGSRAETRDGETFVNTSMLPGNYRLECCADGVATTPIPVEIRPGETTRLEQTLPSGSIRELYFRIGETELSPRKIHLLIRGGANLVLERDCWMVPPGRPHAGEYAYIAGFALGIYSFEVTGAEGYHASGTFAVEATSEDGAGIVIELIRDR